MSRRISILRVARSAPPALNSFLSVPVRSLWNSCLQPSPSRCQCTRQPLALSLDRSPAPHRSYTGLSSSTGLDAHTAWQSRRLFSSPALSSSPSTSDPPPSLPSSAPLSAAVELTDAAARRIGELRARHGPGMFLRLSVDSGGCSGLSYKFEIDKQGQQPDDLVFTHGPGSVLVDNLSLGMLRGSLIDFRVRLERSGFEVVNNPNAAGKCGCGTSFQPKSF